MYITLHTLPKLSIFLHNWSSPKGLERGLFYLGSNGELFEFKRYLSIYPTYVPNAIYFHVRGAYVLAVQSIDAMIWSLNKDTLIMYL